VPYELEVPVDYRYTRPLEPSGKYQDFEALESDPGIQVT
jgi:hypothetical protein